MVDERPKIIVFDLDYTLWPFWVDTHVSPPFKRSKCGSVVDSRGSVINYYSQVPAILEELYNEGYELGVASRTSEIQGAQQLLMLFGWDKYFKYKEIYPGSKVKHFSKILKNSGTEYGCMLFFDDEQRNIQDLTKVGVTSILVPHGVDREIIKQGLCKFATKSRC